MSIQNEHNDNNQHSAEDDKHTQKIDNGTAQRNVGDSSENMSPAPQQAVVSPQASPVENQSTGDNSENMSPAPQQAAVSPQVSPVESQSTGDNLENMSPAPQKAVVSPQASPVESQSTGDNLENISPAPQKAVVSPQSSPVESQSTGDNLENMSPAPQQAAVSPQASPVENQSTGDNLENMSPAPQKAVVSPQSSSVESQSTGDSLENMSPAPRKKVFSPQKLTTVENQSPENTSFLNQARRKISISGSHAPVKQQDNSSYRSHEMVNRGEVRLPNGTQNEFYEINLRDFPQFSNLESLNIHTNTQGLGLQVCPDTYTLQGIISNEVVDDYQLLFYGKDTENKTVKIVALILINPDPKTLWKEIEPDSPYFRKSHQHFESITAQHGRLTAARTRGRSHAMRGDFCEDDFSISQSERLGYFGMVADGAGSARFSRLGSKLLAENLPRFLISCIDQQLSANSGNFKRWLMLFSGSKEEEKQALDIMKEIFIYALRHSLHILHQHTLISLLDEKSKTSASIRFRDLYSTCLAFWAYPLDDGERWAVASFWVGDGALALSHGGKFSLLGLPDGGEFSGQTRFFTDDELTPSAIEARLKIDIYDDLESIWAFSDGITDPKFSNEKQLQEDAAWQTLTAEIKPHLASKESILTWLEFWFPGEHDDRSLCVFEVKGRE